MRCLKRNKRTLYYATLLSQTEIMDDYGNPSGTWLNVYSAPIQMTANISAARGEAQTDAFGINAAYDKTIITENVQCPIDETSVVWIDKTPSGYYGVSSYGVTLYGVLSNYDSTNPKHDYVVVRVAKSLNSVTYAVRKVTAS